MPLYRKLIIISLSASTLGLSGCSILGGSDNNYRDHEADVVKQLEMPPNLFNPGKSRDTLAIALAQVEQDELAKQDSYDHIPNFKADGLAIKSNLSERWLEMESVNSEQIWMDIKRFLQTSGFTVAEERKDIGVLKTEYKQRSELVPLDDVGPITRLLNSWRPELAEGVYDKYIVRVETDVNTAITRVYFSHSMLYSPEANEARGLEERWRIKPYSPVMEAQALYETMIFFGSTSEKALAQLKVSENMVELVDGEEFDNLILRADVNKSWSYLQAMVYRANWNMNKVRAAQYEMWIQVPDTVKKETSFLGSLAFWRESDKRDLPDVVKLQLKPSEDNSEQTILAVKANEDSTPLTAPQRRYIFESLGLLAK